MTSKLVLLKGGKVDRPRPRPSGGGGSKGGKGASKKKGRRPHPWNELLWCATCRNYYPARAHSAEEIAARMTKLSKRVLGYHVEVTTAAAEHCIYDCRRRFLAYKWTLLHVQKGKEGQLRGYVPVPLDVDDEDDRMIYAFDTADLQYVPVGLMSSIRSTASVLRNDAEGILMYATMLAALDKDATVYEELGDDLRYLAKKATSVLARAEREL